MPLRHTRCPIMPTGTGNVCRDTPEVGDARSERRERTKSGIERRTAIHRNANPFTPVIRVLCLLNWGCSQRVEEAAMREPNLEKLNALVGKLVGDLGISLGGASILLGDRLGLYKAMADGGVKPTSRCDVAVSAFDP